MSCAAANVLVSLVVGVSVKNSGVLRVAWRFYEHALVEMS
jgi:hypothetical protein